LESSRNQPLEGGIGLAMSIYYLALRLNFPIAVFVYTCLPKPAPIGLNLGLLPEAWRQAGIAEGIHYANTATAIAVRGIKTLTQANAITP
jgi:hypothetical protein